MRLRKAVYVFKSINFTPKGQQKQLAKSQIAQKNTWEIGGVYSPFPPPTAPTCGRIPKAELSPGVIIREASILLLYYGGRLAIAAGALYVTIDQGVWKDNEQSSKLYEKLKAGIKTNTKKAMDSVMKKPRETKELKFDVRDRKEAIIQRWNQGVQDLFGTIAARMNHPLGSLVKHLESLVANTRARFQPPSFNMGLLTLRKATDNKSE